MNMRIAGVVVVLAMLLPTPGFTGSVRAQAADTEAAMVAAGEWARGQLPSGELRLDPHRTGRSTSPAVAQRVAAALGAELGTLEEIRSCTDPMTPASCSMSAAALLAIDAPAIDGDQARVRVYAWYRQDSRRAPVGRDSWTVTLRRTGSGWEVVGSGRAD